MDIQQKNQMKHHKENLEKQYEQQQRLAPVRVQDKYNKENLETQHKYNLEIFKKQKHLSITIAIITAVCSFITGIVGVFIGYYLNTTPKQNQVETQSKISITQPQNTASGQKVQDKSHPINTKQSVQEESSSKGSLKKP